MPNICFFEMAIGGYHSAVDEFVQIMQISIESLKLILMEKQLMDYIRKSILVVTVLGL